MTQDQATIRMRIDRKEPIAEDICLFELRSLTAEALPPFSAGAHIGVATPSGALRKYSLCNDPAEQNRYVIAVKREAGGRGGSISMIEDTRAGDILAVTAPRNDFALKGDPASYLLIAGGIGITPIRSMIHELKRRSKPFRLYYFTRTPAMMAFRDEFTTPDYRGKAVIHHDGGDPERAFDLWPVLEEPKGAHLYCCGPRGLMEAVRDMTGHWSSAAVHFEDFGTARARPEENSAFTVTLARSGGTFDVPPDKSILEVLRATGHPVASSCESGTCGTCRTGLVAGEPDHRDLALSEHERRHAMLICVSRAKSANLVLDL